MYVSYEGKEGSNASSDIFVPLLSLQWTFPQCQIKLHSVADRRLRNDHHGKNLILYTRQHSSRMCTTRLLTGGGGGGCCLGGGGLGTVRLGGGGGAVKSRRWWCCPVVCGAGGWCCPGAGAVQGRVLSRGVVLSIIGSDIITPPGRQTSFAGGDKLEPTLLLDLLGLALYHKFKIHIIELLTYQVSLTSTKSPPKP